MSDTPLPVLGNIRIGDRDIAIVDCRSWRVLGDDPNCSKGMDLGQCASCAGRESRNGNLAVPPLRVRMPGETPALPAAPKTSEPMRGLGDAVARVTTALGVKPCMSCKQRQEMLNRMVPFRAEALAQNPPQEPPQTPSVNH
jgi:hypothetical protein